MKANNRIDLTGKVINNITVLEPIKTTKKTVNWKCQCHCGKVFITPGVCLRRKNAIRSCGCKRRETLRTKMWKGYKEISGDYWSRLKKGAIARNFPFQITIEDVWKLYLRQDGKCGLTGLPITFSTCIKRRKENQTASLDRIDSSKGYTLDNVMWIHKEVNRIKTNLSNKELLYWANLISNYAKV
jgi:hypothetical protein